MAKRRSKRQVDHLRTDVTRQIIKHLEAAGYNGGVSPHHVFEDFLKVTEATLSRLPEQVRAAGRRGELADDPPEMQAMFRDIDRRYHHDPAVWQQFGQAFAVLLAATEGGLWGDSPSLHAAGLFGPDLLGAIYQTWGINNPKWNASFYTPFSVGRLMAEINMQGIERMVHDRVKAALLHEDNLIGQAMLLASLAVDADSAWDHYLNRLIPAAMLHIEPIEVLEPACGSGILILSAAAAAPEWAVKLGLIRFKGADSDPIAVLMAKCNLRLYGLNGFHLQLHAAALEALEGHRLRQAGQPPDSTLAALRQIWPPSDDEKMPAPAPVSTQQIVHTAATPALAG